LGYLASGRSAERISEFLALGGGKVDEAEVADPFVVDIVPYRMDFEIDSVS